VEAVPLLLHEIADKSLFIVVRPIRNRFNAEEKGDGMTSRIAKIR
jgi:hypothetical protein